MPVKNNSSYFINLFIKLIMKLKYIYITIIIYLIASYFHVGYVHADEYYQIFQFAAYKIGMKIVHMPWEFYDQMRSTFQVIIIYFIYKIYNN